MKIVELKVENVKRVKAVQVKPDQNGGLVIIGGENDQGKSSVLDAIVYALAGRSALPPEPIRRGAQKATIEMSIDGDGLDVGPFKITRTFTHLGSYLTVANAQGAEFKSPQKMLDEFVGLLSFDPLSFAQMTPTAQREGLLSTMGDLKPTLEANAAKREQLYQIRRDMNREAKRLTAVVEAMDPVSPEVPDEEISLTDLTQKLQQAQQANFRGKSLKDHWASQALRIDRREAESAAIQQELVTLKREQAETKQEIEGTPDVSVIEIEQELYCAEATNGKVRDRKARNKVVRELEEAQRQSQLLTMGIEEQEEARAAIFADVQFPVEGLSITDDGVIFEDLPFEQLSSSKQLRVSTAIAMALNPSLRVLRIDNGSLLDKENLGLLRELAEEHDFDIWIERVGDQDDMAIIIEDGAIRAENKEGKE